MKRKSGEPLQTIKMQSIFASFTQHEIMSNSARHYDDQGAINVGDFNFDGKEDFAIQNGNNGAYGAPSYDVYLSTGSKFKYSTELSDIIQGSLGFFEVDYAHKRLNISSKSGCCYHEFTSYEWRNGKPVAVERDIDDADSTNAGGKGLSTHEVLVGDKWVVKRKDMYRVQGYCEEELETLARDHLNYEKIKNYIATKACALIPTQKRSGIFATYYPKRGEISDLYSDDQYKGLDVLVGDVKSGTLIAKYSDPNQFLTGKMDSGLSIDTAPYILRPEQRSFGVRTYFNYFSNKGSFMRLNLFERDGTALRNVLRNLIVSVYTEGTSISRTVAIAKEAHNGHQDLIISEAIQVLGQSNAKAAAKSTPAYRIEYDGTQYILPATLTTPP